MRRQNFLFSLISAALLLFATSVVASAQVAPLHGHVVTKAADGTTTPVANAVIDIFRTDVSGKYETKTNKKGEWIHAGIPFSGTYAVAVSAPGFSPTYIPNVRTRGDADMELTISPGDGRRLTLADVRAAEAAAGAGGGTATNTGGGTATKESAETRKAREAAAKERADIEARNAKNININEVVGRTFKAGNAAFVAKNYDEAIRQYDEGLVADPQQTVLLTNKSVALKVRGIDRYNAASRLTDEAAKTSGIEAARKDWKDAAESAKLAVAASKAETVPTEAAALSNYNTSKLNAYNALAEAMRLYVTKGDATQADAGYTAYQEYIAVETDPAKKSKAQIDAAQMLLDAGASDKAFAEFKKILDTDPENIDASLGAGLALFQSGDKAKFQEAANYLQRFVDKAPDTHKLKPSAKESLEYLKSAENIKPEKTPASTGARRRRQ
jgi:tetratricopeptide (TPR) repeat protein